MSSESILEMGRVEQFVFRDGVESYNARVIQYSDYSELDTVYLNGNAVTGHLCESGSSGWFKVHAALSDRNILKSRKESTGG